MIGPQAKPAAYVKLLALVAVLGLISALITFAFMVLVSVGTGAIWEQAAAAQDTLDLTTAEMLRGPLRELQAAGIAVYLADVHAPVLAEGRKAGLIDVIGEDHLYPTVDQAVRSLEAASNEAEDL